MDFEERVVEFISQSKWYHSIDVGKYGATHGTYDHKSYVNYYQFPDLSGIECLDVGAADGFFSFEFEKMGAKVTAIDIHNYDGGLGVSPSPRCVEDYEKKYMLYSKENEQFADLLEIWGMESLQRLLIVKKLIKSDVVFENRSIYDLSSMGRTFEFVFCGDLMEHLKNPLEAIENLRSVTGNLCVISLSSSIDWRHRLLGAGKAILRLLTKQPKTGILDALSSIQYVGNVSGGAFFHSSPEAFREMCLASGFRRVEIVSTFGLPNRALGVLNKHAIFHCFT